MRPDATLEEIQEALKESPDAPMELTIHYISKLRKKIFAERLRRNDNLNQGARIAYVQDKKKIIEQRLWAEATNPNNHGAVRVAALQQIIKNELDLLSAEMDAGLFKREVGKLQIETKVEHTMDKQLIEPILRAFKNYGLVRKQINNDNRPALPEPTGAADSKQGAPAADPAGVPRV